jgi:FixJ family two-component response regulator
MTSSETQGGAPQQIVFVIDDDRNVREGMRSLMESMNLACEVFATSKEFMNRKLSNETSCLILDIRLQGASGLELQAELARARIDIPIIFITGHGDVPMTVKAMKAGAVEFLTKPVREQDLLDAVRIALDTDRTRKEQELKLTELRARYDSLSEREREVVALVTAGLLNKQIAGQLNLTEPTVKVHRHNLMRKMDAKSLPDLVKMTEALRLADKGTKKL